jgi:protein O-GlcNAc transferase
MNRSDIPATLAAAVRQHQSGGLDVAAAMYRQILAIDPGQADALHLLGVLTGQRGAHAEGIDLIRQAIAIFPQAAAYHNNLGNVLKDAGRLEDAAAAYRRSTEVQPDYTGAHANLGAALAALGQLDDAAASFRAALAPSAQRHPQSVRWRNDMAVVLARMNRLPEAADELRVALRERPDYADAHNNLGLVLMQSGQLTEGIAACRRAVELNPRFAAAWSNLGIALVKQGHNDEAIAAYRRSIELSPDNVKTLLNLAQTLAGAGEMDDALAAAEGARQRAPRDAGPHLVLGSLLRDSARLDESLAAFDRAIELEPHNAAAHSGRIFTRHFHAGSDAAALREDQRLWDQRHALPLRAQIRPHDNDRAPDRPLRVGYVSPDFTNHVLALLMYPLLSCHDRQQYEAYLYSDVLNPTPVTERFKSCAKSWRSIVGLSDERVAELVRQDGIDILVDLTMHMENNRLLMFARKPAPVQVTWCYPGSTGVTTIDYRITDPTLDPPGLLEGDYSERSVPLPDTFFCIDPMTDQPPVNEPPVLESGRITFGCLNNFCKVNAAVVDLWSRVMRTVPDSRMLILSPRGRHRQWLEQQFATRGVDADRIEHVDRRPRPQYLELYHRIDVCLDTFPYNGHTTSLDALWMGVPVVTLVGQTVVGRAGLSELVNLGLEDLTAHDADGFVGIATALCADRPRLASLRAELRGRMQRSPLMDGPRFARAMEAAYRRMWRTWCEDVART